MISSNVRRGIGILAFFGLLCLSDLTVRADYTNANGTISPSQAKVNDTVTANGSVNWAAGDTPVAQCSVIIYDGNWKIVKNITSSYFIDVTNRKASVVGSGTADTAGSFTVRFSFNDSGNNVLKTVDVTLTVTGGCCPCPPCP